MKEREKIFLIFILIAQIISITLNIWLGVLVSNKESLTNYQQEIYNNSYKYEIEAGVIFNDELRRHMSSSDVVKDITLTEVSNLLGENFNRKPVIMACYRIETKYGYIYIGEILYTVEFDRVPTMFSSRIVVYLDAFYSEIYQF